jgi:sugar lactone lactonase YvrE
MADNVERIGTTQDQVGESPIWSVAEQVLYWVDISGKYIRRFNPQTGQVTSWSTPERVGCIALRERGGLLAAMESAVFEVELKDAPNISARPIAPVTYPVSNMRFNDGVCDRQGRFWVGTMPMGEPQPVGEVYVLSDKGFKKTDMTGLITVNGMAFSPDGRKMYMSDSNAAVQMIWVYDFDTADGRAYNRREFVDMKQYPGRPDGSAIDVDGCYWICGNDAGVIHRFTPDGRLDRSIKVPVSKPAKCAFGGRQLDQMYVTSIIPPNPTGVEKEMGGGLFVLSPGVTGIAEPSYKF